MGTNGATRPGETHWGGHNIQSRLRLLMGRRRLQKHVIGIGSDALLALLHPVQVLVQVDLLPLGLGGNEQKEFREFGPVRIVLVATHLEVLVKLLPELEPRGVLILLVLFLLHHHAKQTADESINRGASDTVGRETQQQVPTHTLKERRKSNAQIHGAIRGKHK